ncbi:hypothetical protein NC653_022095 [Populus alba x Populus x berolinensis]|uniref:Uncharacterized protein n=1 Tax=Populus alba x Populus x berolinensis TaxID=444605 RepID=A0AAD6QFH0_9ROSI|nr:hypothetical protein NC653_022095 [Populus alba x Populus x berolinensis]
MLIKLVSLDSLPFLQYSLYNPTAKFLSVSSLL